MSVGSKTAFGVAACAALLSCGSGGRTAGGPAVEEDTVAKRRLQGVWADGETEEVALRIEGDSVFYPDSTSQPAAFRVVGDSIEIGSEKYAVEKIGENIFVFRNAAGDRVRLVKGEGSADATFGENAGTAINQDKLVKWDSVVYCGADRYHCYVQVNPTTYKVVRSTMNSDGVMVDNVYHDNIVHLSIYKDAEKLFSKDFHKVDFKDSPQYPLISQGILSDIGFAGIDGGGIRFTAHVAIPNDPASFLVGIKVDYSGRLSLEF